jgi:hypothetical protein
MLYATFEAKYYGELSPTVGADKTDLFILRFGEKPIRIGKKSKERLLAIAEQLEIQGFRQKYRRKVEVLPEVAAALRRKARLASPHFSRGS